jgi:putative hydrolase of the HAD superfamily
LAEPTIEAVLFDSGGVLLGPVGGRWNPRFDFEATVRRQDPALTDEQFADAAAIGEGVLGSSATVSRDDYHRVMLDLLGVEATPGLLAELDRPLDPTTVVEPYPEVLEVLDTLRARGVRLAVVSDAWPDLPDLHAGVGLGGYFEAYAISAVVGCTKPDPRMYRHASDALGLPPERCLFVDDTPSLVAAAIALGYQGRAVLRAGATPTALAVDVPSIPDLRPLLTLTGAA